MRHGGHRSRAGTRRVGRGNLNTTGWLAYSIDRRAEPAGPPSGSTRSSPGKRPNQSPTDSGSAPSREPKISRFARLRKSIPIAALKKMKKLCWTNPKAVISPS